MAKPYIYFAPNINHYLITIKKKPKKYLILFKKMLLREKKPQIVRIYMYFCVQFFKYEYEQFKAGFWRFNTPYHLKHNYNKCDCLVGSSCFFEKRNRLDRHFRITLSWLKRFQNIPIYYLHVFTQLVIFWTCFLQYVCCFYVWSYIGVRLGEQEIYDILFCNRNRRSSYSDAGYIY